jgi:hypothetical protein
VLEKFGLDDRSSEELFKMANQRMATCDNIEDVEFWEKVIQKIQSGNSSNPGAIEERAQKRIFHILDKIAGRKSACLAFVNRIGCSPFWANLKLGGFISLL